jgi:hypothetical protein
MSFPSSPTNGQLATVNNITYSYNSSLAAWTRATNLLANLTVNSLITGSGAFYPNGVPLATSYTSSTTAPGNANIKDQWYNPSTDVLYEYVTDGTSSYWVDYSSEGAGYTTTTQNIVTSVTPYSNNTINVGAVGSAFANLYISNIIAAGSTITVTGNIVPSANVTYSLGTPTARFSSLYLSGNTIDLGGAVMKTDATTGAIALIPQPTTLNPNPTGIVVSPTGAVSTVATTGGVPSATAIATSSNATVTTGTTFANITVSGNANVQSLTSNTSITTATLLVSGNAIVQGNLQVTGNITTVNYETVLYTETANVIIANSFIGNVHGAAAGANLSLQSNGTTNAVLDTSGRLGIGATPAINNNPLQVNYSAVGNNAFMYINNTDTSSNYSNAGVYFSSKNGASYGSIFADNANSALRLNFNSTNSVYIDSNGNFGVGSTPTDWSVGHGIQIGTTSFVWNDNSSNTYLTNNAYYNSGWKYSVSSVGATNYLQGSGAHYWNISPSGTAGNAITFTTAMTLTSSASLLVNTTSFPSYMSSSNGCSVINGGTSNGDTGQLGIIGYNGAAAELVISGGISGGANRRAGIRFWSQQYSSTNPAWTYGVSYSQTSGDGNLYWINNASTYVMTMLQSGALLIGTTTNSNNYQLVNQFTGSGTNGLSIYNVASSGGPTFLALTDANQSLNTNADCAAYSDSTTQRWSLKKNGGLYNYQSNNANLSDENLKKNITPAKNYLAILNQIPVVTFLFKDQTDTDLNLGVTAQSVQAVAPELVTEWNDNLAIYETDLKYAMLKAIQELSAQVTALQSQVAALTPKE